MCLQDGRIGALLMIVVITSQVFSSLGLPFSSCNRIYCGEILLFVSRPVIGEKVNHHRLGLYRSELCRRNAAPRQFKITKMRSKPQEFDFKEFDIDGILSEAEAALKAAENSLESTDEGNTIRKKSASLLSTPPKRAFDPSLLKEGVAAMIGGLLLGSFLGCVATVQFPDFFIGIYDASDPTATVPSLGVLPLLGACTLGVIGLIGAVQDNVIGVIFRNILGIPVLALVSVLVSAIQALLASIRSTAQQKVEKTANEIKALPRNVMESAQRTIQSSVEAAVEEVTSLPGKARNQAVESFMQAADSVKSKLESAVDEVVSIPRKTRDIVNDSSTQTVENAKSLPSKVKDTVGDSRVFSKEFFLALVLIPALIALGFVVSDAFLAGRLPSTI